MAKFDFKCPQCGESIEADDFFRGEVAECPLCRKGIVIPRAPVIHPKEFTHPIDGPRGQQIKKEINSSPLHQGKQIPEEQMMVRLIQCPYCGTAYEVGQTESGRKARCGTCGKSFVIQLTSTSESIPKHTSYAGCSNGIITSNDSTSWGIMSVARLPCTAVKAFFDFVNRLMDKIPALHNPRRKLIAWGLLLISACTFCWHIAGSEHHQDHNICRRIFSYTQSSDNNETKFALRNKGNGHTSQRAISKNSITSRLTGKTLEHLKELEEMSNEQRARFGFFQGWQLGAVDESVPDLDTHSPTVFMRHLRIREPFDVFTNAEITLVYTPVSKKMAGLIITQTNSVVKTDSSRERARIETAIIELYKAKDYKLPMAFLESTDFQIEEPGGIAGFCVDGRIFSVTYKDLKNGMAEYRLYIAETNLVADIPRETVHAQSAAISNALTSGTVKLDSFCGIKFGDKLNGYPFNDGLPYIKKDPQSGKLLGCTKGKSVKCNAFRYFNLRTQPTASISYKTERVFRLEMRVDSLSEIKTEGGLDGEIAKILKILEDKYAVKPYRLHVNSKYRLSSTGWPSREYLFPLANSEIHLFTDPSYPMKLIAINGEWTKRALDELQTWREERALLGADVLARKGKEKDPKAISLHFKPGTLECFMGYTFGERGKCRGHPALYSEEDGYREWLVRGVQPKFRRMNMYNVVTTWSSHLVYGVRCSMPDTACYPEFTTEEELANINTILTKYLKVEPTHKKIAKGTSWSYTVGDVIVELSWDGLYIQLEARNLVLQKMAKDEAAAVRSEMEKHLPGASAL